MSADNTVGEQPDRRRRRTTIGKSRDQLLREQADGERAVAKAKTRATPSKRDDDEDEGKRTLLQRIGDYFEGVQSEWKKVIWPTNEETRRLTRIVVTTLIATAIALGIIVLLFTELFRIGLNQPAILLAVMVIAAVVGLFLARVSSQRSSY
jgi:preprotein translocase SecE subunit